MGFIEDFNTTIFDKTEKIIIYYSIKSIFLSYNNYLQMIV